MTDTLCPVCHRNDPADGLTICGGCLARIDDDLARIVELARLAGDRLVPEKRGGSGGRSVPGSRPPIDLGCLDDALGIDALPILDSWQRLVREFHGLTPLGPATVADSRARRAALAAQNPAVVSVDTPDHLTPLRDCVAFLRSWLLRCAEDPTFPLDDLAREVRELRASLEHHDPLRDTGPTGTRLSCPQDHPEGDGRRCHGRLTYDRDKPRDDLTCPRCGTTWTGARLLLLALHDDTQTVWAYPADILALVDIPPATLRQWTRRGQLNRDGGRYDIGQAWRRRMGVGA